MQTCNTFFGVCNVQRRFQEKDVRTKFKNPFWEICCLVFAIISIESNYRQRYVEGARV